MTGNRVRAFSDVVSVDAWHKNFGDNCPSADLHADIVFGTALLGVEAASEIRFKLSVHRAEILVILPSSEPIKIDKNSVSRDSPLSSGTMTSTYEKTSRGEVHGKGNLALSSHTVGASLGVGVESSVGAATHQKAEVKFDIDLMNVTQSLSGDGDYRWLVESRTASALRGRPWDAAKEPRLKLFDTRADRKKGISPIVRIEVRCRREDFVITNLEVKDKSIWKKIQRRSGFQHRLLAAEAYIRKKLFEEGLEVDHFEDKFGIVTLAAVIAEPSGG